MRGHALPTSYHRDPRRVLCQRHTSAGWTLLEILAVAALIAILIALALPQFVRVTEQARSTEAIGNLDAIRRSQVLHQSVTGTFVEAPDLASINETLGLDLTGRDFDYEIAQATPEEFIAVATRKEPADLGPESRLRITMDHRGELTYYWPGRITPGGGILGPPIATGSRGGGVGGGVGGIGGIGGLGGGLGAGGGGGGIGGRGGIGGGGGGGGAGGGDIIGTGGPVLVDLPAPPPGGATQPPTFTYIPRGADLWTDWPDVNRRNITGSLGVDVLSQAFDFVANSEARAITDDLFRKGIAIFSDASHFDGPDDCGNAIACFNFNTNPPPPNEPTLRPFIVFNPAWMNETPEVLASVLVHEGTHFQQYLDGSIHQAVVGNLTVIDIEFRAWWNAAVYWDSIRSQYLPIDTRLENEEEQAWLRARQGEAALRDYITPLYT